MAAKIPHPPGRPDVNLYIRRKEKDTKGTRCTDVFQWPLNPKDHALFVYLKKYGGPWTDVEEIYVYYTSQPGKPQRTYRGKDLTEQEMTKLQYDIAHNNYPVDIYLLKKRPGTAPAPVPYAPAKAYAQPPAPKAYASADYPAAEELRDLLQELRQVMNTHDKSHRRYTGY